MTRAETWYRILARIVWLAAGVVIGIWFLNAIVLVLLFLLLTVIFAVALNFPVTWLEHRKVPRWQAVSLVSLGVIIILGFFLWLMLPRIFTEGSALAQSIPGLAASLARRSGQWLAQYPLVREWLSRTSVDAGYIASGITDALVNVWQYTFSLLTWVILLVILASAVVYMLLNPRPLLAGYLGVFPEPLRDRAANAFSRFSIMVVGWLWASVLVGAIEGWAAVLFLYLLGIPGAFIWGMLTFLAAFIPRFGPYLMTIPPALVALAVSPLDALWVVLFYIAINEFTADVIYPWVGGKAMDLHPVSLIFGILAMGAALGFWGALVGAPLAALIKVYYEEFYLSRHPRIDQRHDPRIEHMLCPTRTTHRTR